MDIWCILYCRITILLKVNIVNWTKNLTVYECSIKFYKIFSLLGSFSFVIVLITIISFEKTFNGFCWNFTVVLCVSFSILHYHTSFRVNNVSLSKIFHAYINFRFLVWEINFVAPGIFIVGGIQIQHSISIWSWTRIFYSLLDSCSFLEN